MPRKLRIAYLAHTIRSDWNNGNAHFLRGLLRALGHIGHEVTAYEPTEEWSVTNLLQESNGARSLTQFAEVYPDLNVVTYDHQPQWQQLLAGVDFVILHEWNPPALASTLLALRPHLGYKLLFHDTHHRASSSPEQIAAFGLAQFDGILAFGESLRQLYRTNFNMHNVWTLHEAADTTVFKPYSAPKTTDGVWIGNWGEGERSAEIHQYLLSPASQLPNSFTIYGVRYPNEGRKALAQAGVYYSGYLPNLDAPAIYAASRFTIHIPRQQYTTAMLGIPTIRVFEALACGIPLLSAPWQDTENLFRAGDFWPVKSTEEAREAMHTLLTDPIRAQAQVARGLEIVLAHHTCMHRAKQLTQICEELL